MSTFTTSEDELLFWNINSAPKISPSDRQLAIHFFCAPQKQLEVFRGPTHDLRRVHIIFRLTGFGMVVLYLRSVYQYANTQVNLSGLLSALTTWCIIIGTEENVLFEADRKCEL